MVSTLPLRLADRQPHALHFILLIVVFYFLFRLPLWLCLDGIFERTFRDSSLMQEKLIWKHADQPWWAISADWGELRSMFYFLGAKNTYTLWLKCKHVSLTRFVCRHKEQVLFASLLPLLYQVWCLSFDFCFAFLLSSTFGNTHTHTQRNWALTQLWFHLRTVAVDASSPPQSSGDLEVP